MAWGGRNLISTQLHAESRQLHAVADLALAPQRRARHDRPLAPNRKTMINSKKERAVRVPLRYARPFPQRRHQLVQTDGLALELGPTNRRHFFAADAGRTRDDGRVPEL